MFVNYLGADQGLLNSFFSSWSTSDIHKHLPFIYNLSSNTAYTYSPAFKQFGSSAKVVHFLGSMKPWKYKYNPQTGSVLEEGCGLVHKHQLTFLNLWWEIYHHGILPVLKSIRDEQEHASPRHPVGLGGVGVPCADWAPGAGELCANSVPSAGEACAKSAAGSSQPRPAEGPLEQVMVEKEAPPSPEECHVEDVDLAISISEISIEEKVKELNPEEERRKWEEGRIDYMGKDAFARIQEKLDRFLQ